MVANSDPQTLKAALVDAFRKQYGAAPTHVSRAPGRVNIIGEHTDYNDGFVLPAAIDRAISIVRRRRSDDVVNIPSLDYQTQASFTLNQVRPEGYDVEHDCTR